MSINLGLTIVPEAHNPEDALEFNKIYNALNTLGNALDSYTSPVAYPQADWPSLLPSSTLKWQNMCRAYFLASEAIVAGAVINIWSNAGTPNIRNANASVPQYVRGVAPNAVASGSYGEVFLKGMAFISGLTPGAVYYLSNTAGLISSAPGANSQIVGFALTSNTLLFDPEIK
jgi:hypothetical protein